MKRSLFLLILLFATGNEFLYSQNTDFGDCPDPPFPTLFVSNGANHMIMPGLIFLGFSVDGEPNGQVAAGMAMGDDLNGDDEDGIIMNSWLIPGSNATVIVISSLPCFLNGWIDFNGNGLWTDAGEQVFAAQPLNQGYNYLQFAVPPGALPGLLTYARFRGSSLAALPFVGGAPDGEVEDYLVFIGNPLPMVNIIDPDPSQTLTQNEISLSLIPGQSFSPPALLLAAYNDEPGTGGPGIGVSYSHNGGQNWSNLQLAYPQNPFSGTAMIDMFDPSTTTDINGHAYVSYISTDNNWMAGPASGLFIVKSTDAGVSWSPPVAVSLDGPPAGSPDPNYRFNDRDQITCDIYPQSPYSNHIYATWIKDRGWNMPLPTSDIYFAASADGGVTFSQPVMVNEWNHAMGNMPVADVARNGIIYLLWIDYNVQAGGPGNLFLDRSSDGGFTWGADQLIATISLPPLRLNNNSDVLAKGAALLQVQPADPNELYVSYAADPDGAGPDEADIFFMKSTDGGTSWSNPLRVNNDLTVNDQVLPWMDVAPDGTIVLAWYDRRNDVMDLKWDVYFSVSTDRGISFSPSQMLNNITFLTPNTLKWGKWFGEYLGLVSDYNTVYAVHTTSAFNSLGDVAFVPAPKPLVNSDHGDAPDPYYPTLYYNNGAIHQIDGITYLGALCDGEPDGIPGSLANGDDTYGTDDEDGVIFPSLMFAGTTVTLSVTASVNGYLNGWIDFNKNGNWYDPGEYCLADIPLLPGPQFLQVVIPASAVIDSTYARFRFCSYPGLNAYGSATDGEVEDYKIGISSNTGLLQTAANQGCQLWVRPNPSVHQAVLSFHYEQEAPFSISIMNLQGKVIGEFHSVCRKGLNEIPVMELFNGKNRPGAGIYMVELCIINTGCCKAKMVFTK